METLLLHEDLVKNAAPFFTDVCTMLKKEGVRPSKGVKVPRLIRLVTKKHGVSFEKMETP
jgi:hypothetical protein